MYLWLPMIFNLLITLILTRLNVEKAVEDLKK
jgi:GPH family glycoside/pentoside/hexuronide:cation symporter